MTTGPRNLPILNLIILGKVARHGKTKKGRRALDNILRLRQCVDDKEALRPSPLIRFKCVDIVT